MCAAPNVDYDRAPPVPSQSVVGRKRSGTGAADSPPKRRKQIPIDDGDDQLASSAATPHELVVVSVAGVPRVTRQMTAAELLDCQTWLLRGIKRCDRDFGEKCGTKFKPDVQAPCLCDWASDELRLQAAAHGLDRPFRAVLRLLSLPREPESVSAESISSYVSGLLSQAFLPPLQGSVAAAAAASVNAPNDKGLTPLQMSLSDP